MLEWAIKATISAVVAGLVAAVIRLISRIRANEVALITVRDTAEDAASAAASAASSTAAAEARIAECERLQTELRTRLEAYPAAAEWRQWGADLAETRAAIRGVQDMVSDLGRRVGALDQHVRGGQ